MSITLRMRAGWHGLEPGDKRFITASVQNAYSVVQCLNPEYGRALCRILGLPIPPDCWYFPVGHFGWLHVSERGRMTAQRDAGNRPTPTSIALRLRDGWNALRPEDRAFLRQDTRHGYAVAQKLYPTLGRALCDLLNLPHKPNSWYRPIKPYRWTWEGPNFLKARMRPTSGLRINRRVARWPQNGIRLVAADREFVLSFARLPWFKNAPTGVVDVTDSPRILAGRRT